MAEPLSPQDSPLSHFRNVGLTSLATQASNGVAAVSKIIASNSSGAVAWLQFYDSASVDLTLGTTRPLMTFPMAATSGSIDVDFFPAMVFRTRISVYSATAQEGGTASGAGVCVTIIVN